MTLIASSPGEYRSITEACGVVDRSERGKLALSGGDAASFLQGQVSNDVEALAPGEGCYAAFLTPKGKMLGDLRILRTEEELLLDTERVALQGLFNMVRRFSIGYDVELHKRTLERGQLSLLGPRTEEIAGAGAGDLPAAEHSHRVLQFADISVRAVRTNLGIDLLCDSADFEALTRRLVQVGAAPISEDTAEIVRIEQGRPRYGVDLDESVIPQEVGLNERAVSFTKGCYVGQETVARLFYRGKPNRQLRGLRLRAQGRPGDQVRLENKVVGSLSSVALSPARGPIALALIRREAQPGSLVAVGESAVEGEIVELPFA